MFTDEDRKELLKYVDSVYEQMLEMIETRRVLPASITHNGDTVGATIKIRKIYGSTVVSAVDYSGEDNDE